MPWSFHAQNLCERRKPGGRPHETETAGPMWRHGRCWLTRYGPGDDAQRELSLRLEWLSLSRCVGIGLTVHNTREDDLTAHVGLGLLALWLGIAGVFPRRWRYRKDRTGRYIGSRETSIRFFDSAVWWDVWHDDMSWSSGTPRWRSGCWHPLDTFLGRMEHSTTQLGTQRAAIPLPEGPVAATFRFERPRWRRPRWPWPRVSTYVTVRPDRPIAIPGKGENSWDCGDDAYHEMTFACDTIERAIAHVVEAVLATRLRHGGSLGWQPEREETS